MVQAKLSSQSNIFIAMCLKTSSWIMLVLNLLAQVSKACFFQVWKQKIRTASLKSSTHVSAASTHFSNYALTVMTCHSVFMTTYVD